MTLVLRVLSLLAALISGGVLLSACGTDQSADEAAESARIREQAAASRKREQRIAQLERRLGRLRAEERAARVTQSTARLAASFNRFEATLPGSAGATLGPPGLGNAVTLGTLKSGSAWSTIKVPIALAVLERRGGRSVKGAKTLIGSRQADGGSFASIPGCSFPSYT
jgi:hypothetical protein